MTARTAPAVATTTTAPSVAPRAPQVNLLPDEVRVARTLGVVKRWVLASAAVTAVAIGTVAAVAQLQTHTADADLAQAEADTARLVAQQAPYAELSTVRTALDETLAARRQVLGGEVLWSERLGALVAVTPDGISLTTVDYLGATPVAPVQASTDPLVTTGLGTLTFAGHASGVPDTAAWADALDALPGFSDARIDAVRRDDSGGAGGLPYSVSGSVQVDAEALSHRFDDVTDTQGES
ncbi:PilN domain-containing protein [Cellulomonas endophytica]|uniref:PilN domain-containing protein n=1 Tax=Cellulomonas endophytica TaxID=2494735 RepID=UPI00101258B0|nr:fimbrial assembly protein [Cellulomonas endophytica]